MRRLGGPSEPPCPSRLKSSNAEQPESRFGGVCVLWRRLRGSEQSPARVALAIAVGLFIGSLPLYGLHFLLCMLVCIPRRLDSVLAYLAANISNPLVAPLLITLEVEVGSLLLTGEHVAFDLVTARATGVSGFITQVAVGSLVVGGVLAALGGAIGFVLAGRFGADHRGIDLDGAIRRTLERYRRAPLADRMYVAGKLQHDPVVTEIIAFDDDFGRVLDAGCGRGQLGLCLLELRRVSSLSGFDSDERKLGLARDAGGAQAEFQVRDLATPNWPPCDTAMLIDVLHYLPIPEQDEVLAHAMAAVAPGGRVLVRELDRTAGLRSRVTRFVERIVNLIGLNRGRAPLSYRAAREIIDRLEALGASCQRSAASQGTPFANVLIVARRR